MSYDIAEFIVSEFEKQKLRVCTCLCLLALCYAVLFMIHEGFTKSIFPHGAAVQDGGCEHGNVGGAVQ